jgi:hypothetical protein
MSDLMVVSPGKLIVNRPLNMNGENAACYEYVVKILTHLDRAEPLSHLNQMTFCTFSNVLSAWESLYLFLLGEWSQYIRLSASVSCECSSPCHLLRVTEEELYLLIQSKSCVTI